MNCIVINFFCHVFYTWASGSDTRGTLSHAITPTNWLTDWLIESAYTY